MLIATPTVKISEIHATLEANITINGFTSPLWFKVPASYSAYLTPERSDAFVVGLLFEAQHRGVDISCETPLSDSLHYQLESSLLNFFADIYANKGYRRITVSAPTATDQLPLGIANGTGVSCGIDSLATIFQQSVERFTSMGVNQLCFFDTGSHDQIGNHEDKKLFEERRKHAQAFSSEAGLPYLEVSSNLSDFYTVPFGLSHTYRDAAPVLALQKLFRNYYYASGATVYSFLKDCEDPAYLDSYILPLLSTRNTRFYSSESTIGRLDKTRIVAKNPLSRKHLNVCNRSARNCGNCNKCLRTLMTLDAIGRIDEFDEVFDLKEYKLDYNRHFVYHCFQVFQGDPFHSEIDPLLRHRTPIHSRLQGLISHWIRAAKDIIKTIFPPPPKNNPP